MTCPDSIDVELLHDHDILDHVRLADHVTLIRIHLVAVDALDKYRLTVYKKLTVLDLDIPEADLQHRHLCHALTVVGHHLESIEPWGLGAPLLYRRYINLSFSRRQTSFRLIL